MQKIDELIKEAMKAKNTAMLTGFRAVKAKILIEKSKSTPSKLSDNELFLELTSKEIKERAEANKLIKDGTKPSFIENKYIIEGLSKFIPPKLSLAEQEKLINQIISQTGAKKIQDLGKVMAELLKHKTHLNMSEASKQVKNLLK